MKKEVSIIFRKFSDGDIIALFPYIVENGQGSIMSYEHIGQHGMADYNHILDQTKLATEEEYFELLDELKNIYSEYNIRIIKKMNRVIYSKELQKIYSYY